MQFTHTANPVKVHAAEILSVTPGDNGLTILKLNDGRDYYPVNDEMMARHKPCIGDYLVTQEDGYDYINPKAVFERKYSAAPADPIESEIQAKGLTAPRVTPARIAEVIASEHYFTAAEGVIGGSVMDGGTNAFCPTALALLTFCVLVLRNGFTVTGESACASPKNFDAEIGRKIARENAVNKIWMLEGYLLKERLHSAQALRPTYYVQHPDQSHTVADPQPLL